MKHLVIFLLLIVTQNAYSAFRLSGDIAAETGFFEITQPIQFTVPFNGDFTGFSFEDWASSNPSGFVDEFGKDQPSPYNLRITLNGADSFFNTYSLSSFGNIEVALPKYFNEGDEIVLLPQIVTIPETQGFVGFNSETYSGNIFLLALSEETFGSEITEARGVIVPELASTRLLMSFIFLVTTLAGRKLLKKKAYENNN